VALTLAVLAQSAPATAQTPPTAAEAAYLRARQAFEKHDYQEARRWLEEALKHDQRAVYVYNLARVQQLLGQFANARRSFLRVTAMPDVDADLRRLAEQQGAELRDKATVAVLRAADPANAPLLQVDGRLLADASVDTDLEAGEHQLCVIKAAGARVRCVRRSLPTGVRTTWPLADAAAEHGTLTWSPQADAKTLALNGHVLLVDLTTLRRVEVDAGRHEIRVTNAAGETKTTLVSVLPGGSVAIGAPAKTPFKVADGGVLRADPPSSPGAWPWVVAGLGGASLAAGVALMVSAEAVRSPETSGDVITGVSQRDHPDDWEDARGRWYAGISLVSVGGAAAVSGLAWWLATRGTPGDDAATPAVWVAPWQGGIAAGGRF